MIDLRKLGLDDLSVAAQPPSCRGLELESGVEFEVA
jgi:hypothetical protein